MAEDKILSWINLNRENGRQQTKGDTGNSVSYVVSPGGGGGSSGNTSITMQEVKFSAGLASGYGYKFLPMLSLDEIDDWLTGELRYCLETDAAYLRRRLVLVGGLSTDTSGDKASTPLQTTIFGTLFNNASDRGAVLSPLYAAGIFKDHFSGENIMSLAESIYGQLGAVYALLSANDDNLIYNPSFTCQGEGWTFTDNSSFILDTSSLPLMLHSFLYTGTRVTALRNIGGKQLLYMENGLAQLVSGCKAPQKYRSYNEGATGSGGGSGYEASLDYITPTESYNENPGQVYVSLRIMCLEAGTLTVNSTGETHSFSITATGKWQNVSFNSSWDNTKSFSISFTGKCYIDKLKACVMSETEILKMVETLYKQIRNNFKLVSSAVNSLNSFCIAARNMINELSGNGGNLSESISNIQVQISSLENRIAALEENNGTSNQ